MTKLYIGGLPYSLDDSQLSALVSPYGTVTSARVIIDRANYTSRGFGFVEMSNKEEAEKAIAGLHGTELAGRRLTVDEARPRDDAGPGQGRDAGPRGGAPGRR